MPARLAWLAIGALIVLVVLSVSATAAPSTLASAAPALVTGTVSDPNSALNLTAYETTESSLGPGSPCVPGESGEILVNFSANASGGTPPYHYLWYFGDGSAPSNQQNPSHPYPFGDGHPSFYYATATVTDSLGASASVSLTVILALPCPELSPPPSPSNPWSPFIVGAPMAVAAATAFLAGVTLSRRP